MHLLSLLFLVTLLFGCQDKSAENLLKKEKQNEIIVKIENLEVICNNSKLVGLERANACIAAIKLSENDDRTPRNKTLSLSNMQLKAIPPEVFEIHNLTSLYLNGNALSDIPVEIKKLRNLDQLDLGNNHFTSVPMSVYSLPQLKNLDLGDNDITTIEPLNNIDTMPSFRTLHTINLANNNLSEFPPLLLRLPALRELVLVNNKIDHLPEEIDKLSNLKVLDVSSNNLTVLPESLGQLKSLEILFLFNSKIKHLPSSIGQLSKLTTLILGSNQLESLPDSIGQLSVLEDLVLGDNKLTTLPNSMANLKSLKKLSLDSNPFLGFPMVVTKIKSLEELRFGTFKTIVSKNPDYELPTELKNLVFLKVLELPFQFHATIPAVVFDLPNLEGFRSGDVGKLPPDQVKRLQSRLDAFCGLFEDVMKLDLKPQARVIYITKHIDTRVGSKDLKEAFELSFQTRFYQRYLVIKQAVESVRGEEWTCTALDEFYK